MSFLVQRRRARCARLYESDAVKAMEEKVFDTKLLAKNDDDDEKSYKGRGGFRSNL